jgi:hypothetical protein
MKLTSTFGLTALVALSSASPFAVSKVQSRQSTAAADAINQWDHDVSVSLYLFPLYPATSF